MIILITGASRTGKTLLAQRLFEAYGYPYPSIEQHFRDIVGNNSVIELRRDDSNCTLTA